MATTDLQPYEAPKSLATSHELSPEDVLKQVQKIQQVMAMAMKQDEHYGVIPGTAKPTLLKAGAEKLLLLFRLDPEYEVSHSRDGTHLTVLSKCTLFHIPTGNRMGSGWGWCSTMESKYAYRQAKRKCPKCGEETINRSKFASRGPEPGWYCHRKVGGCGAEFPANDGLIVNQPLGRVANPDLADLYNTVLKMANKRSLVAAVLNVTAASDIFTQDLEDTDLANGHAAAGSGPSPIGSARRGESETPLPVREIHAENPPTQLIDDAREEPPPWEGQNQKSPAQDWLDALQLAETKKAYEHTKDGLKAAWPTFTKKEQDALHQSILKGDAYWKDRTS
jgi:hypothetical protein